MAWGAPVFVPCDWVGLRGVSGVWYLHVCVENCWLGYLDFWVAFVRASVCVGFAGVRSDSS